MGSTHSTTDSQSVEETRNRQLETIIVQNNILIKSLSNENALLKANLAEMNTKDKEDPGFHVILQKLQEELFEFKKNFDKVKETVQTNQTDLEIIKIKKENVDLYTKLKNVDPNYEFDVSKMRDLVDLEGQIKTEKSKLDDKLEGLKKIMEKETTKFADALEYAHRTMESALGKSKKQLKIIEELQKEIENSPETEKIKNILLQQNNVLIKSLMEKTPQTLINDLQKPPSPTKELPIKNIDPNDQFSNNLNINPIEKESSKEINTDDLKILIFYAKEDENDEEKARSILEKLTKKNLSNIKATRMGKKGDQARPMIVTLENTETLNDILRSRYSLKDTEFRGLKIVKFKKDHKKAPKTSVIKKNKAADATNPLFSDESDDDIEEENEDMPFKIVLHYVPEGDEEYEQIVEILRGLTDLPLKDIGYRRVGAKPKGRVRPIVVSFKSEEYVDDALKNRFSLRERGFPKVRVCHYREDFDKTA